MRGEKDGSRAALNPDARPSGGGRGTRYPIELKKTVIDALRAGQSVVKAADASGVPKKTVEQWAWKYRPISASSKAAVLANIVRKKAAAKGRERKPVVAKKPAEKSPATTYVFGVLVASNQNPGGLLDGLESLVSRLRKEVRRDADTRTTGLS